MAKLPDISKTPTNSSIAALLSSLPAMVKPVVMQALTSAPPDLRRELALQLDALQKLTTSNPAAYADLLGIIKRLAAPALVPLTHIAIVGSINVGKSTLFNALTAGTSPKAEVSAIPGTTKENQTAQLGLFNLIDTPGMNHGAESGQQETQNAYDACETSDFIIVVFDATRGITTGDSALFNYVKSLSKPFIVALNKIDTVSRQEREAIIKSCAGTLGLAFEEVNPISAAKRQGIEALLLAAAVSEPRLLGELGRNLPALREKLAWQAIRRAAIASGVITLSPLPIIDFIPLTLTQLTMVTTISRIYGKPMSKGRAIEMLGSLGLGMIGRTIFQELVKLGGPPGWAVSASVAVATTIAIGYCTIDWFAKGIAPTSAAVKAMGKTIQARLLKMNIFKKRRKPTAQLLQKDIDIPLKQLTESLTPQALPATSNSAANEESQPPTTDQ